MSLAARGLHKSGMVGGRPQPFDPDEPCKAHCPDGLVFEGGDPLLALCGKRLIGIEAEASAPKCEECERILDKIYGEDRDLYDGPTQ
jgi:hypothetical protein